ncbi:hypothetical protein MON38_05950 [Hymenobacter sp. DH14]|uniref:Uncharacterized protein n=1 Tax=Hymenobacter cyanobacteriorum TaxID=2926463 RepID=A0A9X2AH24_9BACT|nr:hypothetical protein [Hymenobacter cyanobacteriorum]MCI1186955.1 hypothetical protein [Hymenobacter cyanobacteriorum]
MPDSVLPVVFSNAAGELFEHPAGYGLIRYRAGKRPDGAIAAMLTQAGALLLRRGWTNLLSDTRLMAPLTDEEKAWVVAYWQGRQVARPAHVRVATLLPLDVFARRAVGQIQVGVLPGNIQYKNFGEAAEAHAFLVSGGVG